MAPTSKGMIAKAQRKSVLVGVVALRLLGLNLPIGNEPHIP
jgi:hypothetical protein